MAKQFTDEELNLRRKLRRRLIGAAALTLAVVVILPMVLDSEPKSSGEDIELRIPAADKVGEFVPGKATEEVYDSPASAVSVPVAEEPAHSQPITTAAPSLPITVAASASPVVAAPVKAAPVVAQAAPAPIKKAEPTKPAPPVSKTAPATKVAPAKTTPDEGGFVAQVGAYSSADTAKHELAQLKAWGFKAYTEKAGHTIRVRVGPYAERDKAEKVRVLLEKHGLHPVVTSAK